MKHLPFAYPSDDDQKYLSFFDEAFTSVFIALNPFAQHSRLQPTPHYEFKSERESALLKELGTTVAVTWQEIAELCAFPSVQHVNRALRCTGSNLIDPKFGNTADTETLLKACADRGGSVRLNSFEPFRKWISRSVMPPPVLVPTG